MDKNPKTKTLIVTATRKYVAQEKLVFEIELPNFPMSQITLKRIFEDYLNGGHHSADYWEHDDNFASHAEGMVTFTVENEEKEVAQ